jgi:hypothetical protein
LPRPAAAVWFGAILYLCNIVFCLGWVYHHSPEARKPLLPWLFFSSIAIDIVWLATLAFVVFLVWYRKRKRAELAYFLDLRGQLIQTAPRSSRYRTALSRDHPSEAKKPAKGPSRLHVALTSATGIYRERRIALFFTGCKHAGEYLAEVLKRQFCDGRRALHALREAEGRRESRESNFWIHLREEIPLPLGRASRP